MPSIGITIVETGNTEALLSRLPIALRSKGLKAAVKKSLRPATQAAKRLCPTGGPRIGTKSGKKHLADTITDTVRDYGETMVGVMGASWPAGAHAHLVEFGHAVVRDGKTVGRAAPRPFMRPAAAQTMGDQQQAFDAELAKQIQEASQ